MQRGVQVIVTDHHARENNCRRVGNRPSVGDNGVEQPASLWRRHASSWHGRSRKNCAAGAGDA